MCLINKTFQFVCLWFHCVLTQHTHGPFHEGEKTTRKPEHGTDNQSGVVWSVAGENEWLIKLFTRVEFGKLDIPTTK